MIVGSAFAVFALGLRHGADPDHLAAIDNLTRDTAQTQPLLSRFVGTLFAGGHTVMVLAIAALVGYIGARFAQRSSQIELAGTWLSIVVLFALAALNTIQLIRNSDRPAGLRARLLPRVLRDGKRAWIAIPIGLLFGIGFETSSQIAAYSIAFSAQAGVTGALIVGGAFCVGMICTDTLDSLLVHRLVTFRGSVRNIKRIWIATVTGLAIAIALFELAQVLGVSLPLSGSVMSALIVAVLLAAFGFVFAASFNKLAIAEKPNPPA